MTLVPLLTFEEAQHVGSKLHDHWQAMGGSAPFERDDFAWADIVQRTLLETRNILDARKVSKS